MCGGMIGLKCHAFDGVQTSTWPIIFKDARTRTVRDEDPRSDCFHDASDLCICSARNGIQISLRRKNQIVQGGLYRATDGGPAIGRWRAASKALSSAVLRSTARGRAKPEKRKAAMRDAGILTRCTC